MAAKSSPKENSGTEELFFHNNAVSLCLLVNRRHRTLRIFDFRAGPTPTKRDFVLAIAKRESIDKVFIVVERDQVVTWSRLGFSREGSIPAFYRRNDAWMMGAVVSQIRPMRLDSEIDDDELLQSDTDFAANLFAAKTIQKATALLRDKPIARLPTLKMSPAGDADLKKALLTAERAGRALSGFEFFGRDVERKSWAFKGKSATAVFAGWEIQPSFGSALVELLCAPKNEGERDAAASALQTMCAKLLDAGVFSTFAFSPGDDALTAQAYLASGFKRCAVVARHFLVSGERKDAIVWSKKLTEF